MNEMVYVEDDNGDVVVGLTVEASITLVTSP